MTKLTSWTSNEFEEFYNAWEAAVLWADCPIEDKDRPMSREMTDGLMEDCVAFLETAASHSGLSEVLRRDLSGAGHTAALVRSGHGVSFTDDIRWRDGLRSDEILDMIADGLGPFEIYAGDDGFLYTIGGH